MYSNNVDINKIIKEKSNIKNMDSPTNILCDQLKALKHIERFYVGY